MPNLKVYVAGSSRELSLCRAMQTLVKQMGGEITHDWVEVVKDKHGKEVSTLEAREESIADEEAIKNCDMVLLVHSEITRKLGASECGKWVELGLAIAYNKRVAIYCVDDESYNAIGSGKVFVWHPNINVIVTCDLERIVNMIKSHCNAVAKDNG